MHSIPTAPVFARSLKTTIGLALAASLLAALPSGLLAAEPGTSADPAVSAEPTVAPAQAACESAEDLGLVIDFLQDTDVEADGWVPVVVGSIAGISEARTLVGLVAQTYQPLIEDLIVSLEDVRLTVEELGEMETTGAQIASVGETIADIGNAMDSISTQLRTPCPTD